jgi:hypothetical protein
LIRGLLGRHARGGRARKCGHAEAEDGADPRALFTHREKRFFNVNASDREKEGEPGTVEGREQTFFLVNGAHEHFFTGHLQSPLEGSAKLSRTTRKLLGNRHSSSSSSSTSYYYYYYYYRSRAANLTDLRKSRVSGFEWHRGEVGGGTTLG